jgi:NADH:ubiquinone oxidoreductase subunit 5 (subunit L)/multisubunit Na+/H+ antiporter MnhA subunit
VNHNKRRGGCIYVFLVAGNIIYMPIGLSSMSTVGELPSLVLTVVIIAVISAIGLYILDTTKTELGSPTAAVNTSIDEGIGAVADIPGWLGIVVIVIMGALIIRLLMGSFGGSTRGG